MEHTVALLLKFHTVWHTRLSPDPRGETRGRVHVGTPQNLQHYNCPFITLKSCWTFRLGRTRLTLPLSHIVTTILLLEACSDTAIMSHVQGTMRAAIYPSAPRGGKYVAFRCLG